jgi:peptidoglycan/xylan/chitin deacetylase (PgdA/CDA1 family)
MPDLYRPPAGVLFPYAHIVSDVAPLHIRHLYDVPSVVKFKADLDLLCRRYQPLQLSELKQILDLRSNEGSARYFLLSFDDGMREVYDVIAPILRAKGIPALFFVNSAAIDNRRLLWKHRISLLIERSHRLATRLPAQLGVDSGQALRTRLKTLRVTDEPILDDMARWLEVDFGEYLRTSRPYLTTAQVLELARAGFEFGAHSHSHPYFDQITLKDQIAQISISVESIRALGLPCRCFAFPFNDNAVATSVFTYMKGVDLLLSFGTSEARMDPVSFSFQRFALDAENSKSSLEDILRRLSAKSLLRRLSRTEWIARDDQLNDSHQRRSLLGRSGSNPREERGY